MKEIHYLNLNKYILIYKLNMMKIKNFLIYQKEKVILFYLIIIDNKEKENNKKKVLVEDVIPEEDEEKQKTEIKFYNKNNNNTNNNYNYNNHNNINNNINVNNKELKVNELIDKKNNINQKNKRPNYLKKMIIDVNNNNNINERNSLSPITNINQISNPNNIKTNPLFTSWNNLNKLNQEKEKSQISKLLSSSQNHKFDIFLPEINHISNNSKKNLTVNNNIDTQSTTNESKKNSNSNNTDEYSKDRIDLMSAKFATNLNINSASSNIIIPMIPLRRPNSNFNIGGNLLWEKMENLKSSIINTEQPIEKNNFISRNIQNAHSVERGKVSTAPLSNNTIKLHKIKIEKGMMNSKFADTINKNMYTFELNEYYLNNNNLYNKNNKNNYKQLINNRKQPLKISKNNPNVGKIN